MNLLISRFHSKFRNTIKEFLFHHTNKLAISQKNNIMDNVTRQKDEIAKNIFHVNEPFLCPLLYAILIKISATKLLCK